MSKFVNAQDLFNGDFKFFDITIADTNDNFKLLHGLTYTPSDIIPLSATGNLNYFFRYQDFDKSFIYISAQGPVRLRFLAGKLPDQNKNNVAPLAFVAPGSSTSADTLEDETVVTTLRSLTDSTARVEITRLIKVISGPDADAAIIQNELVVSSDGSTIVESGSILRVV